MGAALPKTLITQEEYLETERVAFEKHEYFQGEVFAMSGPPKEHNRLLTNLFGEIAYHLKGKKCKLFSSDCVSMY